MIAGCDPAERLMFKFHAVSVCGEHGQIVYNLWNSDFTFCLVATWAQEMIVMQLHNFKLFMT